MARKVALRLAVAAAAGLAACSPGAPRSTPPPSATPSAPPTAFAAPSTGPGAPRTVLAAPPPTVPAGPPLAFRATIEPLPAVVVQEMTGVSWRPGCPVPLSRLRLVRLNHWGFDGTVHAGELVVHADRAAAIVRVFDRLYQARFPIRRMVRVDAYGGSDHASMADDNTSMFNCRFAEGSTSWSRHAYGKAIDINPLENPYIRGTVVLPPAGRDYLDRREVRPGMVIEGDVVTRAFAAEGFGWGGNFRSLTDYQHFEVRA